MILILYVVHVVAAIFLVAFFEEEINNHLNAIAFLRDEKPLYKILLVCVPMLLIIHLSVFGIVFAAKSLKSKIKNK